MSPATAGAGTPSTAPVAVDEPTWRSVATSERRKRVVELMRHGQDEIVSALEGLEGAGAFRDHTWSRSDGGGGTARVTEGGTVFERGGVNVSAVAGAAVPPSLARAHPGTEGLPYFATGISMVLHPRNPHVPAFHANFRYFEVGEGEAPAVWWFGGGADLTPAYPVEDDVRGFHERLAAWCARHPQADYAAWKATCDAYFTVRHRGEMRGVGGVFFDELRPAEELRELSRADAERRFEEDLACVADGVDTIVPLYLPIARRHGHDPYGERERAWQAIRRGRYVEFNLVYDRGTLFGLQTGGNVEAILMSMPPFARWAFDAPVEPGSPEAAALAFYQPRDWVAGAAAGPTPDEEDTHP